MWHRTLEQGDPRERQHLLSDPPRISYCLLCTISSACLMKELLILRGSGGRVIQYLVDLTLILQL